MIPSFMLPLPQQHHGSGKEFKIASHFSLLVLV